MSRKKTSELREEEVQKEKILLDMLQNIFRESKAAKESLNRIEEFEKEFRVTEEGRIVFNPFGGEAREKQREKDRLLKETISATKKFGI